MKLGTIEHFEITVTLSTYDCEALSRATRHAADLGSNSGLFDRGVGWTTQEEATHLVGHLEAMSFGFELAAKYAEDIGDLRIRLQNNAAKIEAPSDTAQSEPRWATAVELAMLKAVKRPDAMTAMDWQILTMKLKPEELQHLISFMTLLSNVRKAEVGEAETVEEFEL